jgi:hypothetical protein
VAYLSPDELLTLWQSAHGILKDQWKKQFLSKPQVGLILQFTSEFVIPAVRENEKLVDILAALEAREARAIRQISKTAKLNEATENEWRKSKKHLPPKRPVRTSQQAAGAKGKVPRFDEAHPSEYGSATIRRPGRSEAMLPGREQCPSCGMIVTGNNMKCRCG